MISCKELAKTISSLYEEKSFLKKMEIRIHLLICNNCSRYNKHMNNIKAGYKNLFLQKTKTDKAKMAKLKDKIIQDQVKINTMK